MRSSPGRPFGLADPSIGLLSVTAMTVVVLADTDSRWKWGLLTALQLFPGSIATGMLLASANGPSARQLADSGVAQEPTPVESVPDFVESDELAAADAVVLALPGGGVQAVLHGLARRWPKAGRRPLVVSGYVGVVYEKHVEGLLMRSGSDVILANSPADAAAFRALLAGAGAEADVVVPTVLPFLGTAGSARAPGVPFTVTFAAQPGVPGARADRELVVRRLIRHAALHPEREVLLKVRARLGEHSTHREDHPYQVLGARIGVPRPSNLHVVHGNMGDVLDRTDLLVTVSSTAAVEAMHRGIPTAILTDFGIRERLGNHYFIGSGCLTGFADLDAGARPVADADWARAHGIGPGDAVEQARLRLAELLSRDVRDPLRPFYTMHNASGMLPGLLGRYGLTGHGHALEADDDRLGDLPLAVRSVVARAARTAYRQGVHTVAPALRRLARL